MGIPLVLVEWVDSKMALTGWTPMQDLQPCKPCVCESVGFLLEDEKDYKTLVMTVTEGAVTDRMSIPKVCIKKIHPLEMPKSGGRKTKNS